MNESLKNKSTKEMLDSGHNFAIIGLAIALLAFSLSIISPWVLESSSSSKSEIQSTKTLDNDKENKTDIVQEDKSPKKQTNYFKIMVILLSFGAIFNGLLGMLRENQRYIGGTAILIGVSAIIAQYLWITLTIFAVVILLVAILLSLGVEF